MTANQRAWTPIRAVALCGLALACVAPNPDFCAAAADCDDTSASWCDVDGLRSGSLETCIADPGKQYCNPAQPCPVGPCVDGMCRDHCESPAECDPDRPVCELNSCSLCTPGISGDQLCATHHPAFRYCGDAGACVECTAQANCPNDRPQCSGGRCVECTLSTDCGSGVCNTALGECVESTAR